VLHFGFVYPELSVVLTQSSFSIRFSDTYLQYHYHPACWLLKAGRLVLRYLAGYLFDLGAFTRPSVRHAEYRPIGDYASKLRARRFGKSTSQLSERERTLHMVLTSGKGQRADTWKSGKREEARVVGCLVIQVALTK